MISDNLEVLFKDADDNFHNGRYKDSYQGFKYLYNKAWEEKSVFTAIYCGYRKLICLEVLDEKFENLETMYDLGIKILQSTAKELNTSISEIKDISTKTKMMELLAKVLVALDETQNLDKLRHLLIDLYDVLINEHDRILTTKIRIMQSKLDLLAKMDKPKRHEKTLADLSKLYHEIENSSQDIEILPISDSLLEEHLKVFRRLDDTSTVEIIEKLIEN